MAIRRAVYDRDSGRCTFEDLRTGRRCSSYKVQLHHIEPWCNGGSHSVENLTLRCKAHNDLAAEKALGPIARWGRTRAMASRWQGDAGQAVAAATTHGSTPEQHDLLASQDIAGEASAVGHIMVYI
jgi:5-methylcytosine-specific restriction endonuclease McrA